jgi:transcriptional regulator with XRE-family HTH domain
VGKILNDWRHMNKMDIATAGKRVGLSASTLGRIEAGKTPDGETLLKLQNWLFSEEENGKEKRAGMENSSIR